MALKSIVWLWALAAVAALGDTFVVLPFANLSRNPNLDWIGESIADEMRETLAANGMIVLDRNAREEGYKRLGIRQNVLLTRASVMKIAEAIDAEQVVYGEFEFQPAPAGTTPPSRGTLKVIGHVLDRKNLRQGPEFSELGALDDLAAIQNRVGWRALHTLHPEGAPPVEEYMASKPVYRVDAIENYVRGVLAPSPDLQHRYFMNAIRIEPSLSRVHFRMGMLHYGRKEYKLAMEEFAKVLPVNSHYRESQFFVGVCKFHTSDFAGAQEAFEMVGKDIPLSEVLNNIGVAQARRNRNDEALETLLKALEGDPSDATYQFNVGLMLWKRGKLDEAAGHFQLAVDRDPADVESQTMLTRCQKKQGPRPQDRMDFRERLKTGYEETAWLQLKNMLQPGSRE